MSRKVVLNTRSIVVFQRIIFFSDSLVGSRRRHIPATERPQTNCLSSFAFVVDWQREAGTDVVVASRQIQVFKWQVHSESDGMAFENERNDFF